MNTYSRHLVTLGLIAVTLLTIDARAVTFNFDSPSDYSGNFRNTFLTIGSSNLLTTNAGAISHTSSGSGTAISVYDTTPDTTPSNLFTSVTVEFDFSTSVANSSFGVVFGGTTRTNANLALFNINNNAGGAGANSDQLRIFNGKDWNLNTGANGSTTGPAANAVLSDSSGESSTNNGWTINNTYHAVFTITYTDATTADVSFTIYDPTDALVPVSVTATGFTMPASGGEIGLRTGFSAGGGNLIIDNLEISTIPEPSSYALLCGAGILSLVAVRRRR